MRKSHNDIEIRSKIWIEAGGATVFGRGRRILLEAVETHGSINQAARVIGISYRRAWSYIKAMEDRLGIKLVERQAGGRNGGGAALTDDARDFLKKFESLERGMQKMVDRRFTSIFRGGSNV